ncbi:hypothetical protein N5C12_09835 [Comamonas aquatica]|uniref:hypothetical protein n=1 Tax=Comamonas aquatica TaxID=225991 RepID=UPI002449EDB6|nr:hypothetical protein [Comamonas aquatica]MDH0899651.1 hypothetical protein [Comamonas aquatica]
MAKKSPAKRIAKLEGQVIGMGFLLAKLQQTYGHDFGDGMAEQVKQAVNDYRQLSAAIAQRDAAKASEEQAT